MNEPDLALTSAIFRVLGSPGALGPTELQCKLIAPLNAAVGREPHIISAGDALLRAPGAGQEVYFSKQRDHFGVRVSRRHFTVEMDEHQLLRIRDLGSKNGTLMLGQDGASDVELIPGFSYRLAPGQRLRFGGHKELEYEFLGLEQGAYIRLTRCWASDAGLIDSDYWNWMHIAPEQTWSSTMVADVDGRPIHGPPHFQVKLSVQKARDGSKRARARIAYEGSSGASRRAFDQGPGSKLYGADLAFDCDQPDGKLYRVGYELMLPGAAMDGETKGPPIRFLRPEYLHLTAKLGSDGWPKEILVSFASEQALPKFQAKIVFNSAKGGATSGKSWRHALFWTLVSARLQDLSVGGGAWGWVDETLVSKIVEKKVSAGFSNNVTRWKADIRKIISNGIRDFQAKSQRILSAPDDVDWSEFVEVESWKNSVRLRLHTNITVSVEQSMKVSQSKECTP